jgi:hypothetical protein
MGSAAQEKGAQKSEGPQRTVQSVRFGWAHTK